MKVSYCTTCKGRLEFLKKTLPLNIKAEAGNSDVEFVILDYDSDDGLKEWLFENHGDLINVGRIRYANFAPAPTFRMAHAKNMSHLAASGDILCSLDADNVITDDFSTWLRKRYALDPNFIASPRRPHFTGYVLQRWVMKKFGGRVFDSGLGGRIALSRDNFMKLGGYDERMSAWGGDDLEFMLKARDNGLTWIYIPDHLWGEAIEHSKESRVENLSNADKITSLARLKSSPVKQFISRLQNFAKTGRPVSKLSRPSNLTIHEVEVA